MENSDPPPQLSTYPRHNSGLHVTSRIAYRFTTLSRSELTPYYASFYVDGVKSIPVLELTPLALAVWLMDDGSKSYTTVYFNTQQFDVPAQERLKAQLMNQFGIRVALNRDKTYYRLRMAVESVPRFRRLIEPHLLKEFAYKLPSLEYGTSPDL